MTSLRTICRVWFLTALMLATHLMGAAVDAAQSRPGQEFAQKASWKIPTPQSVRDLAIEWLAGTNLSKCRRFANPLKSFNHDQYSMAKGLSHAQSAATL